jgi:hypothetical protein
MRLFTRRTPEAPAKTKIEQRVAKLPTTDLMNWSDQAIYMLGRDLNDWRRGGPQDHLAEAEIAAESLLAMVREVRSRVDR